VAAPERRAVRLAAGMISRQVRITPIRSNQFHGVDIIPDRAIRQAKKRWKVQKNQTIRPNAD
jgi:hypothetical protein